MKRILKEKPEPLLLVVPLILFLISKLFADDYSMDTAILFWTVFISMIVPFMLHFFLRASRKWEPTACIPHVYFTVGLLVLLFIASMENHRLPSTLPSAGIVAALATANKTFVYIFLLQLALQMSSVAYFLISIFKRQSYLLP